MASVTILDLFIYLFFHAKEKEKTHPPRKFFFHIFTAVIEPCCSNNACSSNSVQPDALLHPPYGPVTIFWFEEMDGASVEIVEYSAVEVSWKGLVWKETKMWCFGWYSEYCHLSFPNSCNTMQIITNPTLQSENCSKILKKKVFINSCCATREPWWSSE